MRQKFVGVLILSLIMVMGIGLAPASAKYPDHPIQLICPWGAGGGTDACSRIIGTLLKKELGVPVNVVNRTGGGGAVGAYCHSHCKARWIHHRHGDRGNYHDALDGSHPGHLC